MTFKKGESGNPGGKPTYSGKMRAALNAILDEIDGASDEKNIEAVVRKLVEEAKGGNIFAIKEVFDRVDGKAMQPIDMKLDATVNIAEKLERRRRKAGIE